MWLSQNPMAHLDLHHGTPFKGTTAVHNKIAVYLNVVWWVWRTMSGLFLVEQKRSYSLTKGRPL